MIIIRVRVYGEDRSDEEDEVEDNTRISTELKRMLDRTESELTEIEGRIYASDKEFGRENGLHEVYK